MMGVYGYKAKKDLKASVGKPLNYVETSIFGPEYKENGSFCVVGPCAYTNRKWFATVVMENGLVKSVK